MMELHREYRIDRLLLFTVIALTVVGVLMVYSSTALMPIASGRGVASSREGYQFVYLKKHLLTLLVSVFVMFVFYRLSPDNLRRLSYPMLIIAILLLLAVFIPGLGLKINGARRWLRLWPSTFQPGEFAKFAMVLFLSRYLSETEDIRAKLKTFMIPVGIMFLIQGILLMQPDFGGAFTVGILTMAILYIAGSPIKYLAMLFAFITPLLVPLLMEPYRLRRIMVFLDPWKDPYGSGFQLVQSFVALGSGGLFGVGLGSGRQKLNFLPEINTDFIFSLIGEELGFAGVLVVITLFVLFFIRGNVISKRARSNFSFYLSTGLVLMVTVQAIINISVVTGLVPTKGLPLPFISYGGSALLVNYMAAGVLLRLSRSEPERMSIVTREGLVRKRARLKARMLRRKIR
ncbi:MAG TPA: putative lipid II flippase FtsW [Nitrospirae bacterium]|nr:putative lipid II flippase FtsW [Nitrospirota bacterium]